MDDLTHPHYQGFSNPADTAMWAWIAGASIVVVIVTFLATAGSERQNLAANIPATTERPVQVPIAPAPITPNMVEDAGQI